MKIGVIMGGVSSEYDSLFPKSALAGGIPFNKLIELLIHYSLDARKNE